MKKLLIITASLLVAITIGFTAGAYASHWMSFTGDEQVEQSDDHVGEIMQILRNVNQDKITAEEALAELQDLNPSGLSKQNKELREKVSELEMELSESGQVNEDLRGRVTELAADVEWKGGRIDVLEQENGDLSEAYQALSESAADPEYVLHLENELARANEASEGHNTTTGEAVEEARVIGGE